MAHWATHRLPDLANWETVILLPVEGTKVNSADQLFSPNHFIVDHWQESIFRRSALYGFATGVTEHQSTQGAAETLTRSYLRLLSDLQVLDDLARSLF